MKNENMWPVTPRKLQESETRSEAEPDVESDHSASSTFSPDLSTVSEEDTRGEW